MAFKTYEPEKNLKQDDVNFILLLIERDLMKNAEAWATATSDNEYFLGQAIGCMDSYCTVMLKVDKQKAQQIFDEHFAMFFGKEVQDLIEQDTISA